MDNERGGQRTKHRPPGASLPDHGAGSDAPGRYRRWHPLAKRFLADALLLLLAIILGYALGYAAGMDEPPPTDVPEEIHG